MSGLLFRQAVPGDGADCVALRGRTRENAVSESRLRSYGITVETWSEDIRAGALSGWICEHAGEMAGYCFGAPETGEVVVLAMLPDFENRGIGRQLLERVVDQLKGAGHARLFLGASPDAATRSYGFYRHLGWRPAGKLDDHGDEILEFVEAPPAQVPER